MSDKGSKIARAFGLTRAAGWLPSKRVTFVIDREGVVLKVISAELEIALHARDALAALEAIG